MQLLLQKKVKTWVHGKGALVFLTFSSCLPAETLDEREDQEDDQRGHANPPERVSRT